MLEETITIPVSLREATVIYYMRNHSFGKFTVTKQKGFIQHIIIEQTALVIPAIGLKMALNEIQKSIETDSK